MAADEAIRKTKPYGAVPGAGRIYSYTALYHDVFL